jgi:hypothetical protein
MTRPIAWLTAREADWLYHCSPLRPRPPNMPPPPPRLASSRTSFLMRTCGGRGVGGRDAARHAATSCAAGGEGQAAGQRGSPAGQRGGPQAAGGHPGVSLHGVGDAGDDHSAARPVRKVQPLGDLASAHREEHHAAAAGVVQLGAAGRGAGEGAGCWEGARGWALGAGGSRGRASRRSAAGGGAGRSAPARLGEAQAHVLQGVLPGEEGDRRGGCSWELAPGRA